MPLKVESIVDHLSWEVCKLFIREDVSQEKLALVEKSMKNMSEENIVGMMFAASYFSRIISPDEKSGMGVLVLTGAGVLELERRGLSPYPTKEQLEKLEDLIK